MVALLSYVPATFLTLLGFVAAYQQTRKREILVGIAGIIVSLLAPILQQLQIFSSHLFYIQCSLSCDLK